MNIIEIGANDGSNTSKFFKDAMIWSFEPNPFLAKRLEYNFKNNSNIQIIQKAVSDYNGTTIFNISEDGQSSSLYELSTFSKENTKIKYVSQILVDVIRMDTFLIQNNIDVVDYFHCDAQGNDLTILKSFGDKLSSVRAGKIEVSLNDELYKNVCNDLETSISFLTENGFKISNLYQINMYKLDSTRRDCNIEFHKQSDRTII